MDNRKFGRFIRESRKAKGLTQKQLAEQLHVSDKAVSKWENGAGFPDIKILEPLAQCLGVSLLELMQSERKEEGTIDRQEAEQAVADTISKSRQLEEEKRRLWKVKLLLMACTCGILYLICVGIGYLLRQGAGSIPQMQDSAWYESPVLFYVWAGILVMVCGAASVSILWKNEMIGEVKIGRHKLKSILTILMDMLVVFMLHTYLSNIANNRQQLLTLPEAIPVNAYIATADGSRQSGIYIRDALVQGLLDSGHVDDLKMDVRLKAGIDRVIPGKSDTTWNTLNLYLQGVNCIEAVGGIEPSDVVWNTGEDASFLQGTEEKCIVSKQLFERKGWKLGQKITLDEYYYDRKDEQKTELFMNPLDTVVYEIAGYVDFFEAWEDTITVPPDVIVPFYAVRNSYQEAGIPFFANSASFFLKDALQLNEFKQEMKEMGLKSVSPTSQDSSLNGTALHVNDAAFINTASHLRQVIDTVTAFFPFLLALIVCVGYLITLLLLQSRKKEMALLRSIGLNKKKCFRIFFADQLILVITGVVVGSVLSVLIQGNYGGSSVLTGCLVVVCYMAGNSLALWRLLKVSVMEALFQAE